MGKKPLGMAWRASHVCALLAGAALATSFASIAGAQDAYDEPAPTKPRPQPKPAAPAAAPKAPTIPAADAPKAVPPQPGTPQPGAPQQDAPQRGAPQQGAPQPGMDGLPAWHPPITPPPRAGAQDLQRPRPGDRNELLEQLRAQAGKGPLPGAAAASPKRFPRDAHGYCIGRGPDDPPANVNLLHGWLGANNEKAVPAPPRRGGPDWIGAAYFGSLEWWKWRLTPYAWRYDNHDDECDPRNQPIPLIASLINFAALLFVFVRFGKKPLVETLRKRKFAVMAEIDRAAEIKASAVARVREYEEDLAHLDDKLTTLRDQYTLEGEHEEKRLRDELATSRDRMMADVAFRLDQEGKTSRERLSQGALEGALTAAEALLSKKITAADHERLAEEFLEQLGPALKRGTASSTGGAQ